MLVKGAPGCLKGMLDIIGYFDIPFAIYFCFDAMIFLNETFVSKYPN